jgi:hypothetical protein
VSSSITFEECLYMQEEVMTVHCLVACSVLQPPQLTLELLQCIAQRIIPLSQWRVWNLQVVDSNDHQQHLATTTAAAVSPVNRSCLSLKLGCRQSATTCVSILSPNRSWTAGARKSRCKVDNNLSVVSELPRICFKTRKFQQPSIL